MNTNQIARQRNLVVAETERAFDYLRKNTEPVFFSKEKLKLFSSFSGKMIDPKLRKELTALEQEAFKKFSNPDLLSEKSKELRIEAENLNFIPKGISKKTLDYKKSLEIIREQNYLGKWYESGWYNENKPRTLIDFYYSSKPDKGQRWFYSRDNLPYTNDHSTGVYYDITWSGLHEYFPTSGKNSLSNLVLGGYIGTNYHPETFTFPYRNFNEFFDHNDRQVGDMGYNIFYDKINAYIPNQPIGYNRIFFAHGLNKQNVNAQTKVIILSHSKDGLPFSARGGNIETTGTLDNRKWFKKFEEKQLPRFDVFFYSEDINLTYVPKSITKSYFGYGPIIQPNNPKYPSLANENFFIEATGVYPEELNKNFCCYNTGIAVEEFYLSVSNSKVLNIMGPINDNALESKKTVGYIWTNEGGNESGKFIKSYKLGRESNSNFKLKINTKYLSGFLNQDKIEYVNIYKVTGINENVPADSFPGFLSEKFTVPVYIKTIDNNTKIFYSGFLENNKNEHRYLASNSFVLSETGILNKKNKNYTVSFYSTGENIKSPAVISDILNRKNKTGPYSGQDIKNIYPPQSAEAYLSVASNEEWINLKDSEIMNFKWIEDETPSYSNSLNGNLKCDSKFEIDTTNMLPSFNNIDGSNYSVTFDQDTNKFLFNNSAQPPKIFINKNYRFLFTNFSDNNFSIQGLKNGEIKTYEPEYNKKFLNNFKLVTLRVFSDQINNVLFWSGNPNGNSLTGEFEIINDTGSSPNPYYLSQGNHEYLIYNICPSEKTQLNSYIPGSQQLHQSINKPFFTEDRLNLYSFVNFYPSILNKFEILSYKDSINNPCRQLDNTKNWHIAYATPSGAISGCFSDQEFLVMLDQEQSLLKTNPPIVLTTGIHYHFIRPASTEKELNLIQLKFFTHSAEAPEGFVSGLDGIQIDRKTHLDEPNYLLETFGDFKTKYFDHISFYVPTTFNENKYYYYGRKRGYNNTVGTPVGIIKARKNISNENYSPVNYTHQTTPIFSGDIHYVTSDTSKREIKLSVILSGSHPIDYLEF